MLCCLYSLNILKNDFLHHNRSTYKYLGDDTENLNTSAILSMFEGKNIPDPAQAEKQVAETSPKTGGSNSLKLNLLHAWATPGTRKTLQDFAGQGVRTKEKKGDILWTFTQWSLTSCVDRHPPAREVTADKGQAGLGAGLLSRCLALLVKSKPT